MKTKYLVLSVLSLLLIGCTEPAVSGNNSSNQEQSSSSIKNSESNSENLSIGNSESVYGSSSTFIPEKQTFENIKFDSANVMYDGKAHTLEVSGAPEFATVTYSNAGPFTEVGEYKITALITAENYNDLSLSATLTIYEANVEEFSVEFKSQSFEYDGLEHSIEITGALPDNAVVQYTSDVPGITNTAVEIGVYNITATITAANYNPMTLNAKLTIQTNSDERDMIYTGSTLYFQNALDENKLYAYANGSVLKVNNDTAVDMIKTNSNSMRYINKSLLFNSIKEAKYSNEEVAVDTLISSSARYIQQDSNGYLYYAKNGLTNEKSGIYKLDLSGEEPVETLLSAGKAYYLQLDDKNDILYFADGANDKKLSKLHLNSQVRQLVVDDKINNLVLDNSKLYYTVNRLLGDYLEKYDINASKRTKLTIDAGASLTVMGDYLYYVNVDKLTATLFGDNICRVATTFDTDTVLPGSIVIEGNEEGVCSLETDGTNIYYYDCEGYKLMKYNPSNKESTNLLDGFKAPEPPKPLSTGGQIETYNGKIYYLNIWDGKALYCYNPNNKMNYRVYGEKVVDFSIIGDELYFNGVSYLVNNSTYRINLKTGGLVEKINDYSAKEICSDGTYIYYIEENAAGAATAIHKANMDGTNDEIVYDKGVSNLRVKNNKLYFIDSNNIHILNLQTKADTEIDVHTTTFDMDDNYIYYRRMYGLAWAKKCLARMDLNGENSVDMVVADTDPTDIACHNDEVYYYTETTLSASKNGIYKVKKNVVDGTGTLVLLCDSKYYASEFCVVNNLVYFVNYSLGGLNGDSKIYSVSTSGGTPTVIS